MKIFQGILEAEELEIMINMLIEMGLIIKGEGWRGNDNNKYITEKAWKG